jgi:FkbM family methyltransferase
MLRSLHHYAHAIETRLFQLEELARLRARGVHFDRHFYVEVLRAPGTTEDWVNLARFLNPSEKVLLLDVGANVGDFTAAFLAHYKQGRAICFEPVQSTFDGLTRRFAANNRVLTHRCALSDAEGEGTIHLHADNTLNTLTQYTEAANAFYKTETEPSESTPCKTLDSFALDQGAAKLLVKIDVQGLETEVIRGGLKTMKGADVVLLECAFANEYQSKEPSFAPICAMLKDCDLYPIVFQDYGRSLSNYAFERDVLFVKRDLLDQIWFAKTPSSK